MGSSLDNDDSSDYSYPQSVVTLNTQYRMRPSIFHLSNKLFYQSRGFDIKTHTSLCDDTSNMNTVQFIQTPHNSELKTATGICNKVEADMIVQHVASLCTDAVTAQVSNIFLILK